jgi:hypothetical protein
MLLVKGLLLTGYASSHFARHLAFVPDHKAHALLKYAAPAIETETATLPHRSSAL